MYALTYTNQYHKSVKLCKRRGYDMGLLEEVLSILAEKGHLPPKYKPHKLSGIYQRCWECHIQPDWLLIWEQNNNELLLLLLDTGTHSDLF